MASNPFPGISVILNKSDSDILSKTVQSTAHCCCPAQWASPALGTAWTQLSEKGPIKARKVEALNFYWSNKTIFSVLAQY